MFIMERNTRLVKRKEKARQPGWGNIPIVLLNQKQLTFWRTGGI